MRWVAVIALSMLGLLELVLRCIFVLALVVSVLGLLLFDEGARDAVSPALWTLARRIVDGA